MKNKKEELVPEEELELVDEQIEPQGPEEDIQEPTELELLQKQLDELTDRNLRLMAEYDNFRKRSQREKEDLYTSVAASTLEKFLPIIDSFERAVTFKPGSEDFKVGFDLIHTNFSGVLEAMGVVGFGEIGDIFDPVMHNAVSHIEDEAMGENVISQVLQRGYKLGDRIIRYAMVQTAN